MSSVLNRPRRLGAAVLVGAVLGGPAVVVAGTPAAAAGDVVAITPASRAYVDSHRPQATFIDRPGDLPVGRTRHAGADRVYRSFLTFDLGPFRGRQIERVELFGPETRAADCAGRSVELWTTAAVRNSTTWKRQPGWQQKVATSVAPAGTPCPHPRIVWDATAAVRQAVAAGQDRLTLGLRATDEEAPGLGRWFGDLQMSVVYNTPPDVPVPGSSDGRPCATEAPYPWVRELQPRLTAAVTDADGGILDATFAVWPADDPARRTELQLAAASGSEARLTLRPGVVADGGSYAWSVRATDREGAASEWSAPCYFRVDATRPASPPVVSSADYPTDGGTYGGQGIAGVFTFSPNGVDDVVGYQWGWNGSITHDVAPNQPDGSARVSIAPPRFANNLTVLTVDRAGNFSDATLYQFNVRPTAPILTPSSRPGSGRTVRVELRPGVDLPGYAVTGYSWAVNGGPATTVDARPDGTATVTVPLVYGGNDIVVTSRSANGWVSPESRLFEYADNSPMVESADFPENREGGAVGQPGTFTLTATLAESTTFAYSFDHGTTWQQKPVGADGRATVSWTPDEAGEQVLTTYSQKEDGTESDWGYYGFTVRG